MRLPAAAACVVCLLATSAAPASITYNAQDRWVSASVFAFGGPSDGEFIAASGFELFDQTVTGDVSGATGSASAMAFQHSELQEFAILGTGAVGSTAFGEAFAEAESILNVYFSLDEPVAYEFEGRLNTSFNGWITLNGPGAFANNPELNEPFSFSGVLPAGSYSLAMGVHAVAFSQRQATGDFGFSLQVVPFPGTWVILFALSASLGGRRRPGASRPAV